MKLQTVRYSVMGALGLLLLLACLLHAQTKPVAEARTPETVAARALAALKENRIADFARAMHPEALKQLRSALLAVVDAAEKKDRTDEVLNMFKNVESADALRKLDDVAFFTAFFEGAIQLQPRLRDAFRGMKLDVIGHVAEGRDVIHVVYRGTVAHGKVRVSEVSVMSLKSDGNGWGMLLTGDIESMAATLLRQFDAED